MKQPRSPAKPHFFRYEPKMPEAYLSIEYAPKNKFEAETFNLFQILEKTIGVDPSTVKLTSHSFDYDEVITVSWPDPNAVRPKNPYYDKQLKQYKMDMDLYEKSKAKYEADLVTYEAKLKKFREDDKVYKIWFYEKELEKLKK